MHSNLLIMVVLIATILLHLFSEPQKLVDKQQDKHYLDNNSSIRNNQVLKDLGKYHRIIRPGQLFLSDRLLMVHCQPCINPKDFQNTIRQRLMTIQLPKEISSCRNMNLISEIFFGLNRQCFKISEQNRNLKCIPVKCSKFWTTSLLEEELLPPIMSF